MKKNPRAEKNQLRILKLKCSLTWNAAQLSNFDFFKKKILTNENEKKGHLAFTLKHSYLRIWENKEDSKSE